MDISSHIESTGSSGKWDIMIVLSTCSTQAHLGREQGSELVFSAKQSSPMGAQSHQVSCDRLRCPRRDLPHDQSCLPCRMS